MTNIYKLPALTMVILSLPGLAFTNVAAQQTTSVRQEVSQRLQTIKPKDTKNFVYTINVPVRPHKLPSSLRLDLVYKIGHYSWDLVALRFERSSGSPFVDISQVIFSSAFPFIKEDMKVTDSYSVKLGELRVEEFDRLLELAYTLYRSQIEVKFIGPPDQRSYGTTGSSGDGTILLQLANSTSHSRPIIRESGTLHVGALSVRIEFDYEPVRVHLFWQVFHEYLESHSILNDMDKIQAVDLLISRLKEPPMIDSYKDYFRQSLYVETLGELGSVKAIQSLEDAAQSSRLEDNWKASLKRDVSAAIDKINAQSTEGPK